MEATGTMSLNRRQLTPRQLRKQLERQWRRSSGKRVKITGSAKGKAYLLNSNPRRLTTHGRPIPEFEIIMFQGANPELLAAMFGFGTSKQPAP